MKSITPSEFLKTLDRHKINPLYFLEGPDQYFQDKLINSIQKIAGITGTSEFDRVVLYGTSTKVAEIIEQLEMMPFMDSYRLIILKNADQLLPVELLQLEAYLSEPVPTSIFIITSLKKENKGKFFAKLKKQAIVIECKQPYGAKNIIFWLNQELQSRKITIEPEATNIFANSIDPDYLLAANELEKLLIYIKDSTRITAKDVMMVVGKSRTNNIFNLQNALGDKDLKKAMTILENLIDNREPVLFIVTMLTRFFARIWKVRVLIDQKTNKSEIVSNHLKDVFHSFRHDYLRYALNYDLEQIRIIFDLLLDIDTDLKSIDVKEEILIERLILKICRV